MISYELHKYAGGRWALDTVFDEKTTAVSQAKELLERSRMVKAIRVMAVQEDDAGYKEWTVYKQSVLDEENQQARERVAQTQREVEEARAKRRADRIRARALARQQRGSGWGYYAGMALRVALIATAGVFLYALVRQQGL